MSRGRPPRRRRVMFLNVVDVARSNATLLTPAEVDSVIRPLTMAVRLMREGVGSEMDWVQAASAVNIALAIERQGVIRGLAEHLHAAEQALQGIYRRAMDPGEWQATPLFYQEIETLNVMVELHQYQLEQLSYGEYRRAMGKAVAEVQSTGGRVVDQTCLEGIPA